MFVVLKIVLLKNYFLKKYAWVFACMSESLVLLEVKRATVLLDWSYRHCLLCGRWGPKLALCKGEQVPINYWALSPAPANC